MGSFDQLSLMFIATALLSLRFIPMIAFSPPFTLIKAPAIFRVLLALSLAFWLVQIFPAHTIDKIVNGRTILFIVIAEIAIGITIALPLQWAGAAVFMTGRAVDIQAGFGLALLADPTTRSQIPLLGTILIYAMGMIFFAAGGGQELIIIFAESLKRIPLGAFAGPIDVNLLSGFISAVLAVAIGLVGMTLLTLFMIDMTVGFLSRTLPQMNVLLIGFQIKTMAVLITLPIGISISSVIFLKLIRMALQTTIRVL